MYQFIKILKHALSSYMIVSVYLVHSKDKYWWWIILMISLAIPCQWLSQPFTVLVNRDVLCLLFFSVFSHWWTNPVLCTHGFNYLQESCLRLSEYEIYKCCHGSSTAVLLSRWKHDLVLEENYIFLSDIVCSIYKYCNKYSLLIIHNQCFCST